MNINIKKCQFIVLLIALTVYNSAFSDPFGSLGNEMWDIVSMTWNDQQLANFKAVDVENNGGRLTIKTKTDGFSFGGKGSKYLLKGDFDIQTDLTFDLFKNNRGYDQIAFFSIHHGEEEIKDFFDRKLIAFAIVKFAGKKGQFIVREQINRNKQKIYHRSKTNSFDGSLRFVRVKRQVTAYYRKRSQTKWKKVASIPFISKPVMVTLGLRNYKFKRTSISSANVLTAIFDNFSINSVQEIIEPDI